MSMYYPLGMHKAVIGPNSKEKEIKLIDVTMVRHSTFPEGCLPVLEEGIRGQEADESF